MIKPITFCIPTANNERDYILLLLESLKINTQIDKHEILIFVDSDNQNTYESLLEKKSEFPNMRIYRNETVYPIGTQRNVSIMFNEAKNDIVCYLQSDMVVGKNIDKHISDDLRDINSVLSFTRIEPPLHPPSPEKIVENLGITPEEFDFNKFNFIVDTIQSESRNILNDTHFAPFALFKKTWFDVIGGFDTQFRCSREDSDFVVRCKLNNISLIQSWKTIVYHFTCVSSRGIDWYKTDEIAKYKNELQKKADVQEVLRFIRKWGKFGHKIDCVYDIGFFIDMDHYLDPTLILNLEPYVSNLYFNDKYFIDHLVNTVEFNSHYYSNLRWKYTLEHWNKSKNAFNLTDFSKRIKYSDDNNIPNDIVISCKNSDIINSFDSFITLFNNLHETIHQTDVGTYDYEGIKINIKHKTNKIDALKSLNTNLGGIINKEVYIFI